MKFLTLTGETAEFRRRYRWMGVFAAVIFLVLLGRLFWLQVVEGGYYYAESERNFVRETPLAFTRGIIRDREGRPVATNRPSNDLYLTPEEVCRESRRTFAVANPRSVRLDDPDFCPTQRSKTLPVLAEFLDYEPEETAALAKRIETIRGRRRNQQILVKRDLSRAELARIETHRGDLLGVDVLMVPARTYPYESIGAHGIGYLNEVSAEDLASCPPLEAGSKARRPAVCGLEERGYRVGDVIGRGGVERAFEQYLRGKRGVRRSVVDAHGHRLPEATASSLLRVPAREEPVPGHDLTLTLDLEITQMIDRAFRGQPAGAVALVEVQTGRVLALYSKPSYDPNLMLSGLSREEAFALFTDPDHGGNPLRPLTDRTLFENYFPGSTYKIVTALAALEHDFVTPEETIHCQGWHELGRRTFRCSQPHGNVNMRDAIVQSCNVYFYRLAERVGMDRIAVAAQDLGFGNVTGVGLNREAKGTVPTRHWYQENRERLGQFVQGFTLNSAIGQGSTKVTLLQLAMAYAAIANGGILYVPQVVREIRTADGAILSTPDFRPRVRRRISATRNHLALLQQGLWGVVNEELGTAYEYRIDGVDASGKTGTAQVSRSTRRDEVEPRLRWYFHRDHAWFAGYAPADAPELAVVVLIEHGGQGGKNAAPIGLRILRDSLERLHHGRPAASLQRDLARRPVTAAPDGRTPTSVRTP